MLGPCWNLVGTILDVIGIKYIFVGTVCMVVISTTGTIEILLFGVETLVDAALGLLGLFKMSFGLNIFSLGLHVW